MSASVRRGVSWPTAWSALVPVYGLALALHAFFPLFSVPVWGIYVFYGFKVLGAARQAEDPWEGGAGPRRYLVAFLPLLVVNLLAFTVGMAESSGGVVLLFLVTLILAYGVAAEFTAASAPTALRREHLPMRAGIAAAVLSAVTAPAFATFLAPLDPTANLVLGLGSVALALVSWFAFSLAERASRRSAPLTARKEPKV